ncbi:MAG: E3 binding domain-containing protein [Deinococcales bacterium]
MSDVKITSGALKLAQDNDIDWQKLEGSGLNGKIVERDILAAITDNLGSRKPSLYVDSAQQNFFYQVDNVEAALAAFSLEDANKYQLSLEPDNPARAKLSLYPKTGSKILPLENELDDGQLDKVLKAEFLHEEFEEDLAEDLEVEVDLEASSLSQQGADSAAFQAEEIGLGGGGEWLERLQEQRGTLIHLLMTLSLIMLVLYYIL